MSTALAFWLAAEARGVQRTLRMSDEEVARVARERLKRLLLAAAGTRFHAERMRAAAVRPHEAWSDAEAAQALRALGGVTKQDLRDAGDAALLGGRAHSDWYSSRSSGSTGEPFRVYYDVRAWAQLKYLVKLRARYAGGMRPHHRVALLDAIPVEEEGRTTLERAGRVRRISVLQPAERIMKAMRDFRPHIVYGLPSSLVEAAETMDRARDDWTPLRIFTSGEILLSSTRRALSDAYGCPVLDVYGTSETKEIAWQCAAGNAHVNADVVLVEVLDEYGVALPRGEEGELAVTLLVNHAMPLIRYITGDRGALLAERCPCGIALPLLGVVTGRVADTLELADGHRLSPYAITTALERIAGLRQYQVIQAERMLLDVRAVLADGVDPGVTRRSIESALLRTVPGEPRIRVQFVERLQRGGRIKLRAVQPLSSPSFSTGGAPNQPALSSNTHPE